MKGFTQGHREPGDHVSSVCRSGDGRSRAPTRDLVNINKLRTQTSGSGMLHSVWLGTTSLGGGGGRKMKKYNYSWVETLQEHQAQSHVFFSGKLFPCSALENSTPRVRSPPSYRFPEEPACCSQGDSDELYLPLCSWVSGL